MLDQAMVEYQATDSALPDWPVTVAALAICKVTQRRMATRD